jgi:hypothetical protein
MSRQWLVKGLQEFKDQKEQELQEAAEENERLQQRADKLLEDLNECQSSKLQDPTVAENINNINDILSEASSPGCGLSLAAFASLLGFSGSFNFCGIPILAPPNADGSEGTFIVRPIEIDGQLTYPNINATIARASNLNSIQLRALRASTTDMQATLSRVQANQIRRTDLRGPLDILAQLNQNTIDTNTYLARISDQIAQISSRDPSQ